MATRLASAVSPMIYDNSMARPGPLPSDMAMRGAMASVTPWNENHTSGFVSDVLLRQQYQVKATQDGFEKQIPVGSLLFLPSDYSPTAGITDDTPRTVLPLHGTNMLIERFYNHAWDLIKSRGSGGGVTQMQKFIAEQATEAQMNEFYESEKPDTRRDPNFIDFHYLTVAGIMTRIKYGGVQVVEPVRKGPYSYATNNVQANVAYGGPVDLLNVFPESYNQGECFLLLKRVRVKDPRTGEKKWGPFAFIPYCKPPELKVIPHAEMAYESFTGIWEEAYVIPAGTMLDIQGMCTDQGKFRQSWGITRAQDGYSTSQAHNALINMPWCRFDRDLRTHQQFVY